MSAKKPTALRIAEGNLGKRPLPQNEPKPEVATPSAPKHLDAEARKEWRRLTRELGKLGLLTRIDRAALALYCQAWSRLVNAENMLATEGLIVISPNGYPQQSPWLAIANKAGEVVRRLAIEFGMTPVSRSRATVTTPDDPDADFFAVQ